MKPGAITTRERSIYGALTALTFLYVLVRATVVPLVHDEAASYLWFVQPGELIPFHAHWDANNHVVNTLCGWLGDRLFGTSLLALRWGNVAAFAVYALAGYRLGRYCTRPLVRWLCWSALLLCPFALDLFSLFRGYGIGLAGLFFGIERIVTFCGTRRALVLWSAVVALVIAVYADLSLLPTTLVLVLIAVLGTPSVFRRSTLQGWSAMGALAFGGLASGYAVYLGLLMQRLGLLYHGSLDGFIPVTVGSLCRYVLGSPHPLVIALVVALGSAALLVALGLLLRSRAWDGPLAVVFALLVTEVIGRIVLGHLFHVNFPEDRAAVHLVPISVLLIALVCDALARQHAAFRWGALVLLILPLRVLVTLNLDHTQLWPEQSIPPRFLRTVAALQQRADRPLVIGGYHQLQLSWPVGAQLMGVDVPLLECEGFPEGTHDLRIVDARFIDRARVGYHELDQAEGPGLWLLQRDVPPVLTPIDTTYLPGATTDAEFVELAHPPLEAVRTNELMADIRFNLTCRYPTLEIAVVTEVNDGMGNKLYYDTFAPLALCKGSNNVQLHVLRRIPRCPTATRAVIYIYNGPRRAIAIGDAGVVIMAVRL